MKLYNVWKQLPPALEEVPSGRRAGATLDTYKANLKWVGHVTARSSSAALAAARKIFGVPHPLVAPEKE
jgi:hypothetical protein